MQSSGKEVPQRPLKVHGSIIRELLIQWGNKKTLLRTKLIINKTRGLNGFW